MIPSAREVQKKFAKEIIEGARKDGYKLERVGDIKDILRIRIKERKLSKDCFDRLSPKDLRELLKLANGPNSNVEKTITEQLHSRIPAHTGPVLPPTPAQSEQDEHSQPGSDDGTHHTSLPTGHPEPTMFGEEEAETLDITVFHPKTSSFFLVRGSRWEQRHCYISIRIVHQNKLSEHVEKSHTTREQTIRLTCREQAKKPGRKGKSTCFRIVADEKITHDIVIGTSWNESDSYESNDDDDDQDDDDDDNGDYDDDDNENGEYDQYQSEEEDERIEQKEDEDDNEDDDGDDDDDDNDHAINDAYGRGHNAERKWDSAVDDSDEFDAEDQEIVVRSVHRKPKSMPRSSKSSSGYPVALASVEAH
ncbi:hypothetical protein EV356DRAFT_262862 [Viridothelium virens]|uniref:Uncharacterized protein n=1 Tax=Viridothelium virens TaxID=1048519 RepID=A0A6A6HKK9_VIRVR|nr:hypothetical protein EV356DRAFT_262862 [Viridothelium virens]